jgi:Helix-turn-helix domain
VLAHLGVQPTIAIAAALGRGEPAVRSRARKLGVRVGTVRGLPILRVARMAGISENLLRAYIRRGELPSFKGAKHLYIDAADLLAVDEIDWQHAPAELEAATRHSLRLWVVRLLAYQSGGPRHAEARPFVLATPRLAA